MEESFRQNKNRKGRLFSVHHTAVEIINEYVKAVDQSVQGKLEVT